MPILCLGISASAIEIRIVTGDQDTMDVAVIGKRQFYLINDEDGEYRYVGFIGLLADGGKLHNLTLKNISLRTARPANDVMVYYTAAAVVDGELSDCIVEKYEMEKMSQGIMTKWSGELLESK